MKKNCINANREFLKKKQIDIADRLLNARKQGDKDEEALLTNEYREVLKLSKMALG